MTLSAARGKLWQTKPDALGLLKDWSVPQAWFLHFYLIGAACNAATLLAYACGCCGGAGGAGATLEQVGGRAHSCLHQHNPLHTPTNRSHPPTDQPPKPTNRRPQARAVVALALFQLHLVRRAAETAGVMRYPADARMHGIAYLFGLR